MCVYSAHYLTRLVESDGAGRGEGAWVRVRVALGLGEVWVGLVRNEGEAPQVPAHDSSSQKIRSLYRSVGVSVCLACHMLRCAFIHDGKSTYVYM